ncbi:hypothetical protein [Ruminococcus callidus]|uniref:hypothetical protein n=1 Tax=Ruminococcus callidus TaxID=40519 RepID=UPI0023F3C0DE|nr:hypothetical protein [Ruminococcus callidus]
MDKSICQLMNFRQITLQWIEQMLFYDKIRLKDIPTEIRISSADIYIIAFRISRNKTCHQYLQDLEVLCSDLITMENQDPMKSKLLRILSNALKFHDFGEKQELVDFQKNMPEILLRQLQAKEQAIHYHLKRQFNRYYGDF